MSQLILASHQFQTPLGTMLAIADDSILYCLTFVDSPSHQTIISRVKRSLKALIKSEVSYPIRSIQQELDQYFNHSLREFKTSYVVLGTDFQKKAQLALNKIPYGHTQTYREQALAIHQPQACRAVANANRANPLCLLLPCHRVINSNQTLGGYRGGIQRKQWLLNHEKNSSNKI